MPPRQITAISFKDVLELLREIFVYFTCIYDAMMAERRHAEACYRRRRRDDSTDHEDDDGGGGGGGGGRPSAGRRPRKKPRNT